MASHAPSATSATSATFLDPQAPLAPVARRYLDELLVGRRRAAAALVFDALHDGAAPIDVYLHVFQRTQQEIGRLWEIGELTVAQEHMCTAATQVILGQVQGAIEPSAPNGRRFVAASPGGNMHEVGIRVVTDVLEAAGWTTLYLGSAVPVADVHAAVVQHRPELLALSAAMSSHVAHVTQTIALVRGEARTAATKILVGGRAFLADPELWKAVGADAFARDASEAIALAAALEAA